VLGRDYGGQNCSVARALEVVGERWTLLIVRDAFLGVTRFDGFARKIGVAPNVLARRLETLCRAGVLSRTRYQERPPRYEYALTDRGRALFPVIMGLLSWGDALGPAGPPALVRHAGCGGAVTARALCERCGADVEAGDAEWYWGPGSGRPERRFLPPEPRAPAPSG
jgi:DNA-binding HxlR family transcriptional regulator